ncbi:MAG: response regulator [Anaerolineae bacterium]|nr:MAG: response regulator [Anaerolineae bacterium]
MDLQKASTWTVCIVEDEPDNMTLIAESLEFFGVKVVTARDGVEGLALLETVTPTLILMDLSMPRMDGWEMHRRLKEHEVWRTIPVIALTAHAMSTDRGKVMQAGFDGYMTKPVNIPTLLRDIHRAIEDKAAQAVIPPIVIEIETHLAAVPEPKFDLTAASEATPALSPDGSHETLVEGHEPIQEQVMKEEQQGQDNGHV